jgi:mono/diheme cytochrome c family protein
MAAVIAAGLALLIAVGAGGWAAGHNSAKTVTVGAGATTAPSGPVDPTVAAGAHTFVQFACGQCHGDQGQGGVSPDVPGLAEVGKSLTAAEFRQIIDHGLGVSSDPKKPFMPVWGPVMSNKQINDLIAYLHAGLPAVPDATPVPVPSGQGAAVAGAALYVRYGCINCHGPNGLGGVPNPESEDKVVPPLSGADFFEEFNTDAKITDYIRSGSVLGKAPIVSMPHWGGIISDAQMQALVAYIKTLKSS